MDKLDKKEEETLRQWIQEVPLQRPSHSFVGNVMEAIEARKEVSTYRPLISRKGWLIIAVIFFTSFVLLYLFPMGGVSYFDEVALPNGPMLTNPFEGIQVSKTMLYAIGCLGLFLVQIPFLKRLMDKQLS